MNRFLVIDMYGARYITVPEGYKPCWYCEGSGECSYCDDYSKGKCYVCDGDSVCCECDGEGLLKDLSQWGKCIYCKTETILKSYGYFTCENCEQSEYGGYKPPFNDTTRYKADLFQWAGIETR